MATIVVNRPDFIEFKNLGPGGTTVNVPTATLSAGSWSEAGHAETGVVIDVSGSEAPLLTPADARKLAKWLMRAADDLEGTKTSKRPRHKPYEEDDENNY